MGTETKIREGGEIINRKRELPRYKFHLSNSGSLITFFKVASRSSTKLVKINWN